MIAEFGTDDTQPSVARFDGKVAVYCVDDGNSHGFLLPDIAAVDTATKMLGAVADIHGSDAFSHPIDGITFQVMSGVGREPESLVTFRFNGVPVSATLDTTQIAEIAAAFTAACRHIDGMPRPRKPDR